MACDVCDTEVNAERVAGCISGWSPYKTRTRAWVTWGSADLRACPVPNCCFWCAYETVVPNSRSMSLKFSPTTTIGLVVCGVFERLSIKCWIIGLPAMGMRTFGTELIIREPFPAASIIG